MKTKTKKTRQAHQSEDIVSTEPAASSKIDEAESESSEEEPEWTVADEKTFLQTLGALKGNSDNIYNNDKKFWERDIELKPTNAVTKKKEQPMFLKDYERKLIMEKGGKLSDEEEDDILREPENEPSYYEQQEDIRRRLKETMENAEDDDDDDLFTEKVKSAAQQETEEDEYYKWLKEQKAEDLPGGPNEMKSLKEAWNKPDIDEDEKFLRDYLLNKDYETGAGVTVDEMDELEEDDKEFEEQAVYEQKYNFRFEDPDQDFIKQYPRTVTESIRTDKTKRKEKREDYKQRKTEEKDETIKNIKQRKQETKKHIEKKLEELKALAGNDIAINIDDLEGDFDPKEYDKRMQELFNDKYYKRSDDSMKDVEDEDCEDEQKPVFSDDDEDEDKPVFNDDDEDYEANHGSNQVEESDDDSVDDKLPLDSKISENQEEQAQYREKPESRRKRNRKAGTITEKPFFNPKEKTFEEYFNEYHALDYEDVIGDQVTRFRYRDVVANDYGLTPDEILYSDDLELNKWVSLKKATGFRSNEEELYDLKAYEHRSKDTFRKEKIFRSIYGKKKNAPADDALDGEDKEINSSKGEKKRKRQRKRKTPSDAKTTVSQIAPQSESTDPVVDTEPLPKNKRTRKRKPASDSNNVTVASKPLVEKAPDVEPPSKKKRTRKSKSENGIASTAGTQEKVATGVKQPAEPVKNKKFRKDATVSDDRLLAYGINPKKFNAGKKFGKRKTAA